MSVKDSGVYMKKTLKAIRWMASRPNGGACTSEVYKGGPDRPERGTMDTEQYSDNGVEDDEGDDE